MRDHLGDRIAQARQIRRIERAAHLVAQRNVRGLDAQLAPIRVAHLHGRVDEHARTQRGERELAEHAGPVRNQHVGREHRIIRREIALEVQVGFRHMGITLDQRHPTRTITFRVFRVRAHDNLPTTPQQLRQELIGAGIQQVVLLPRRRHDDNRALVGHLTGRTTSGHGGHIIIQQVIAAFRKVLRRKLVQLFFATQLGNLVRADAQHRIVVVVRLLGRRQVHRRHMVRHEHVFCIFAHIRTFDVVVVQILQGGHHHVGVHLHHERDGALLADVIRLDARLLFDQRENAVVRVVCDVMDVHV